MPVYRFDDATHTAMRGHDPFEHSEGVTVPRFHFLAEGQPQHDGSWIVHCSTRVAEWLTQEGFAPELVSVRGLVWNPIYDPLAKQIGIWSMWTALGGHAHDPQAEPPDEHKAIVQAHANGEISNQEARDRIVESGNAA